LLSLYLKGRKFLVEFAGSVEPVTDDKTVVDYTIPRHARANFGLGEELTGGLSLYVTGPHGLSRETFFRNFDSIYVFREPVNSIIAGYGSYNPDAFHKEVQEKQDRLEYIFAHKIIKDVSLLAVDFFSQGMRQESLNTINQGLSLVPLETGWPLLKLKAKVLEKLGRDDEARQSYEKAKELYRLYRELVPKNMVPSITGAVNKQNGGPK
jgi:tetratricopeptide (TPR) repeat protein